MSLNLENIHSKFYPNLLGHDLCPAKELKNEMDAIFQDFSNKTINLKEGYVFDAGNWILKLERPISPSVPETTPDAHIYRVRKAEKIQKYIESHGLQDAIMVPKKYIYWCKQENRFYVVSEKVALSNEVAKPASEEKEAEFKKVGNQFGGQAQALLNGAQKRDLTAIQAKALAELSFSCGYTDQSYNNVFFTTDGKVAILDTEPVKRAFKKRVGKSWFVKFFGEKIALLARQSFFGTVKLRVYSNAEALKEINAVETKQALWSVAKLVCKIALGALAITAAALALPLLPVGAVVVSVLQGVIISALAFKTLLILTNTLSVLLAWKFSREGEAGIQYFAQQELAGVL